MNSEIINILKNNEQLYTNYGVTYLGLFGSQARGDNKPDSDVDLLVDFNQTKSLFELSDVLTFFEDTLNRKVDLVRKNSLKKSLVPYVYKDLITVYEKR